MKRDFLRLTDLTAAELDRLVCRAKELKATRKTSAAPRPLSGRSIATIYEKSSTRTRVSFEVGIHELGAHPLYLNASDLQMGRGEPIADTARVLSSYVDAIVYRCKRHTVLEELARHASVPVINGLSDETHPVQVLADLFTMYEHFGRYRDLTVAWVGDGNNMANAWLEAQLVLGFPLRLACPKDYRPDETLVEQARKHPGFLLTDDPAEAATGADVINTDVWVSMGDEAEEAARKAAFAGYRVDRALLGRGNPGAIALHCLPAHRGEEISADVIDDPATVIFTQAENRLHAQKALMEFLVP